MINKYYSYFIYIISNFINNTDVELDNSIDPKEIYKLAQIHNVLGIEVKYE